MYGIILAAVSAGVIWFGYHLNAQEKKQLELEERKRNLYPPFLIQHWIYRNIKNIRTYEQAVACEKLIHDRVLESDMPHKEEVANRLFNEIQIIVTLRLSQYTDHERFIKR